MAIPSAVIAITVSLLGCMLVRADEPLTEAVPDSAWDAVFDRTEGWIGGDAIYSTPLPDGDILWLFADTILGGVRDGRRQSSLQMVNNTLGRTPPPRDGLAPEPRTASFLWGSPPDAEKAASWIVPDPAIAGDEKAPKQWYWVGDALLAPDAAQRDRLIIFLWLIASAPDQKSFPFRVVGNTLAIVDVPRAIWTTWRPRQVVVTHAVPQSVADIGRTPEVIWGSRMNLDSANGAAPQLLIYGYRQRTKTELELVLARAPAAEVERMGTWQFRTADGWSDKLDDAAALATGVPTEFSVTQFKFGDTPQWALVHSDPELGSPIFARTARSPYGPFSAPKEIYRVPGLDKEKKHFTYSGKVHPELSRPGELLVSYVVNSFDFGESLTNAAIYRPRFIRVPASSLPPPPSQ